MKSRANIKGHPLHPILVAFPIAFFIGTLVFDGLYCIKGNAGFWQTGKYLETAGIITGLLAAVPGIIDYVWIVPPKSSGKKRATQHGLVNLAMIIAFAIALYLRNPLKPVPVIALEIVGVILLSISGWLGGTLVYRNQIGVDSRYADAGKWKEIYLKKGTGPIAVADDEELKTGQMKLLHISGKRIVLAKTAEGYVAFDDRCTHRGGSLADGTMICGTVQCPWHGSQFDTHTGAVTTGPATKGIKTYSITQKDHQILLEISPHDKQ